jgi:hypothetical protein
MVTVTATDPSGAMDMVDVTITVGAMLMMDIVDEYDTDGTEGIQKAEYLVALRHYIFGDDDGMRISKADYLKVLGAYLFPPTQT